MKSSVESIPDSFVDDWYAFADQPGLRCPHDGCLLKYDYRIPMFYCPKCDHEEEV